MSQLIANFAWVRLSGEDCQHNLLVRVLRTMEEELEAVDLRRGDLIKRYLQETLYTECRSEHNMSFCGASELRPIGSELVESSGGDIDIWIASAEVPGSSMQLGTAETQGGFWVAFDVHTPPELKPLVHRPAKPMRVRLIAEDTPSQAEPDQTAPSP